MLKKYLLSSVARIPEDESGSDKSPVEKLRESIKVTTGTDTDKETETETDNIEENADGKDKENEAEAGDEGDKEGAEETETDAEDEEETGETGGEEGEKTPEQLAKEKAEATTKKEKDRIQRRIDREVAKRKAAETELAALKAKVEASGEGSLTQEEANSFAEAKAKEIVAQKEFIDTCNKLFEDAVKIDKDFKVKVDDMADDVGPIPGDMIGVLSDLDNGGKVLTHLADNPDEYENLFAMTPLKRAVALTRLSDRLKPAKKPVSKVPPPNEKVHGSSRTNTETTVITGKENMKEYVAKRQKQIAEKRAAGRVNLY